MLLRDHRDGGGVLGLPTGLPANVPIPSVPPAQPPVNQPAPSPTPAPTPAVPPVAAPQQPAPTPGQPQPAPQPAIPGQPPVAAPANPPQPSVDPQRQAQLQAIEKRHREAMSMLKQNFPDVYEQVSRRVPPAPGNQPPAGPPSQQQPQRDQWGRFIPQPQQPSQPNYAPADPFAPPPPAAPYGYPPQYDAYGNPIAEQQLTPQAVQQMITNAVNQTLTQVRATDQQQRQQEALKDEVRSVENQWDGFVNDPAFRNPDGSSVITQDLINAALAEVKPFFHDFRTPGGPTRNFALVVREIQNHLKANSTPAQMAQLVAQAQQNAQQTVLAAQPAPMGGPGQPDETQLKLGRYQRVLSPGPGAFLSGKAGT